MSMALGLLAAAKFYEIGHIFIVNEQQQFAEFVTPKEPCEAPAVLGRLTGQETLVLFYRENIPSALTIQSA